MLFIDIGCEFLKIIYHRNSRLNFILEYEWTNNINISYIE